MKPKWNASRCGTEKALLTRAAAFLLVVSFTRSDAAAQTLVGRVLEERGDASVSSATISLIDTTGRRRAHVIADSLGRFSITPPREGEYVIEVMRLGYETTRSPLFALVVEGTFHIDLLMRPEPIGLEGLEVPVHRPARQFLQNFGHTPESLGRRWIDREAIENQPLALTTGDVIRWRAIVGLWVRTTNESKLMEPLCVTSLRQRGRCAITLLNGVRVNEVMANQLSPDEIEAIAILSPVDATTFYGTEAGGGAVLIWTRQGRR